MSIVLDNVSFTYPGSGGGVREISLTIETGELVAVIGPSGCGKTTILRLIAGFLTPQSGRILFDGVDASTWSARERDLGIVFQNYALFPHMRLWENIAYPLKLRGVSSEERRSRALAMLGTVGLSRLADRYPDDLSGGQQQRVALSRALVFQPRALLLDEPLSALDASLRVEMRDEIRRLQRAYNIATLHITHDQEEALSMADRVAVMSEGQLQQIDTPRQLYARPANRIVAGFVGHSNLWNGVAVDQDQVSIPLGVLKVPGHGQPQGSPVTVLVRPEGIRLGTAGDGSNQWSGIVGQDRFLGSLRRVDFAVQGGDILIETTSTEPFDTVHIPPASICVMAADNPAAS